MFYLLLSAAQAATINLNSDFKVISNAPPSERVIPSVQHVGHSDETVALGAAIVHSTWAPLDCEIVAGGELYVTLDDRDISTWPSIPTAAVCTKVYGGNTYVWTINLVQYTHDWAHEGDVTSLATGADFRLGTNEGCAGSVSELPAGSAAHTVTSVTAVKTGGGAWTGVTCSIVNAQTGSAQFLEIHLDPASAAGTGTCTMPKSAGGNSVVPVSITR